ncbi:MAG: PD-(D/E)XK nuclease family protein [Candidatus Pacearchaeota archaeon]|jgi:hypothetical protein
MNYKLSPSSLSLMHDCPRCFWLEKHKVWQRPAGIFPSLPSGMDRILKIHFDKFRDRGMLPPELCTNHDCSSMRLFGINEDERELLKVWRDGLKGVRWQDKAGNVLCGAVDTLLVKDKKLIVLDYKTRGFPLRENTHEYYKDQIDIYTFLLRKNGFETEDFGFLLFYFPDKVLETGEVLFETKLIKLNVNIKNAEELFMKGLRVLEGDCPRETCEWCERV